MRKLETELKDRTLRFDGVSIVHPDSVASALARGLRPSDLRVTEVNEDVETFNANVVEGDRLKVAGPEPISIPMEWQLPEPHRSMNLNETIVARAVDRLKLLNYAPEMHERAVVRIQAELEEIESRGMIEFMKTIIYILDTFRKQDIVWGVGRGSSCACYILFILGLHVVDCVKYEVPMNEFFHD